MDPDGVGPSWDTPPSSPVPAEDLVDWLCSLHLPQYAALFAMAGLRSLAELRGLTAERLQAVADFPTGHRRRMLCSLEALGLDKPPEERAGAGGVVEAEAASRALADTAGHSSLGPSRRRPVPVPRTRHVFPKNRKRGASCHTLQAAPPGTMTAAMNTGSSMTLPGRSRACPGDVLQEPTPPGTFSNSSSSSLTVPRSMPGTRSISPSSVSGSTHSTSSSESLSFSSNSLPSDLENVLEQPAPSSAISTSSSPDSAPSSLLDIPPSSQLDSLTPLDNVQGDFLMVDNDIYEMEPMPQPPSVPLGQRNTRSYRLRHRPVPKLPEQDRTPKYPWNVSAKSTDPSPSQTPSGNNSQQKAPLERKVSVISPYGEVYLYNNPGDKEDGGAKEQVVTEIKEKLKQKRHRKKQPKQNEQRPGSKDQQVAPDPVPVAVEGVDDRNRGEEEEDADYSTVQGFLEPPRLAGQSGQRSPRSPSPANLSTPAPFQGQPPGAEVAAISSVPVSSAVPPVRADENGVYTEPLDALPGPARVELPEDVESAISPYACFYGGPRAALKTGWLDKLSPQGNRVFQKRWVKFDGENLTYYNNDKEMYSKGLIPLSSVKQVRALGDNRLEVVTCLRTFVFRAEREGDRQEWLAVLQEALDYRPCVPQRPPQGAASRCGPLELRGHKGRVYVCLLGTRVRLCKTEQDFSAGLAIAVVELTSACVKHVERRGFEINTPFKTFCFTAESERERDEWVEAVQECIVETLSDYEVAEKIWYNEANRNCADCRAPNPEWASINLVVVICKKCAAQHRFLGPSISQVRSLKLDSSIWSNELVELFLEVGNKNANSFWAATLSPEDELHMGASAEQRATFHRRKYRQRMYRHALEGLSSQDDLNKALCAAVVLPDVLRTMALVFSGADVMCATGDPGHSTPYLLAQKAAQRLQMEFLYHNKLSDFPKLEQVCEGSCPADIPSFMDGFLYCSITSASKATLDRRGREDMVRRWCTLEGGFLSYYESEKIATATGRVEISEMTSLAINRHETMTGSGAVFTFEMYLPTEKVLVLGAETAETHKDWACAVSKCFLPVEAESILRRDCELIGRLYYKEGHDLYHWRVGWFGLEGSDLYFCSLEGEAEEGVLQLKRLQEITVSTHVEGEEKIQVLLMVESGRTVYIHGHSRLNFTLWHAAIQQAAGTDGRALGNQQLSKNDIPIVVDSCIAFVTQYGLCHEGIYQKSGDAARVSQLLDDFRRDARNVKLRAQDHLLGDVTDTLKAFLAQSEDALLTKELYPYWVSALDEEDEECRVQKYSTFIRSLPQINRSTLKALLQHLYRIQSCSHINQMSAGRLASVLSSCLFQTEGQREQECRVVEDLISNYVQLFTVNEEQVKQMEKENSFITRWKDSTFSPAGDLIFEVYLEKKEPETCCIVKVSPTMHSVELASCTLGMKGLKGMDEELWTTYEVLDNGELERPLHYKEKILEQVLEWSSLEDPSSAFLIVKKFPVAKLPHARAEKLKDSMKGEQVKFKDGSSKLLSGNKFQDRYLMLRDKKLVLYKDMKSTKPEREVPLKSVKCYLGVRRKMKAPSSWGFTVFMEKQQWYFCCDSKESRLDWVTCIIRSKHGSDFWPKDDVEWGVSCPSDIRQRAVSAVGRGPVKTTNPPETKRKASLNIYGGDMKPSIGPMETIHQRNAALIAQSLKQKELPGVPDARHKMADKETNQADLTTNMEFGGKSQADSAQKTTGGAKPNLPEPRNKMVPSGAKQPNSKPQIPAGGGHHQPVANQRPTKMTAAKEKQQEPTRAHYSPRALLPLAGGVPHGLAQQKKVLLGTAGGQLPPNLLSELSTVLSKTGRSPKDES
ncbi:arf-GAP with Rho-GAP domain, ANK repeat and PH domain-containing protein 2 isoform X2 [Alosa sapidissima]|uniref:arf-GAP with Rho-GAP domain, ANK repeat and PH domain-containing protein 2 isoform X2 n=1 Tax=Alosa sapidissima TaxID=34773 RepID=UPI001C097838|nr:arf-GAP with Rho-GAP domain, ANK repeat and PH domain-containing protein 2 isoform X2 [Alosa sapidissima]